MAISPRIVLVPIVPDPLFWSIRSCTEKVIGYFFYTCWKTLANQKPRSVVAHWMSSWFAALWSFSIAPGALCQRSVSTWPSPDPQTTKTTTMRRFLIDYCFSTGQLGQKRGRLEAIQDNNRADYKNWFIGDNLVQIRPIGKNNPWWNGGSSVKLYPDLRVQFPVFVHYSFSNPHIVNLINIKSMNILNLYD